MGYSAPKHRRRWPFIAAGIAVVLLVAGGILFWQLRPSQALLPEKFATRTDSFQHYFYFGKMPAGYHIDEENAGYAESILIIPLKKPDQPTVVMTQQRLSEDLDTEELMKNGDKVTDAVKPAVINSVEGRLVGILIDKDGKTLVLLNSPGNTDKETLKALLQGLRPVKR